MKVARISGTENYAEEAPELLKRYESITFADAHSPVLHLIPPAPCRVLDIGAGTGRDAAGFITLGHSVVAVEPTEELRRGAMLLHPSSMIEWLDDSLPDLTVVRAHKKRFSELAGEAACNQEYTGGLQQGLDNEAAAIVAQRQASVLKHPGIAALDRPAMLSQP